MNGQQFIGNVRSKEIHDLDNETDECHIDEIIKAGNDKPFAMLSTAHAEGFDNCANCLRGSTR